MKDLEITKSKTDSAEFSFSKDFWLIKINKEDGIQFNRIDFPLKNANDFAIEFMDILEKNFNVKFEEKAANE